MASLSKRGKIYYVQYYVNGKQVRKNLYTPSLQVAKEKMRQFESALFRDEDVPQPTRTPLSSILAEYVDYLFTTKNKSNVQKIAAYLREAFGPICAGLAGVVEQI